MFNILNKILGAANTAASDQDALDAHLALAVLLFEAAHADGECSDQEKAQLSETLVKNFGVARDDIDQLLEKTDQEREEYVDLFRYTRYINDHFSEEQKMKILESVWEIILVDGHLEAHEDHFVHKLASLFTLNHKDLIDAKRRAREKL